MTYTLIISVYENGIVMRNTEYKPIGWFQTWKGLMTFPFGQNFTIKVRYEEGVYLPR